MWIKPAISLLPILGGLLKWDASKWEPTNDNVRPGGNSSSTLSISPDFTTATFSGYLDAVALSGAGFASQRTVGDLNLDLSSYTGLVVNIKESDGKNYTLTVKDELPLNDTSSLLYAVSFVGDGTKRFVWDDFVPTYRGRVQEGAKKLDTKSVKQVSLMIRSFFGVQSGEFKVVVKSIAAYKGADEK